MESLVFRGHIKSWDWLRPFREQILIEKTKRGSKGGEGGERREETERRGNSRGLSHDKMETSCCGHLLRWQISQHAPLLVGRGENSRCTRKGKQVKESSPQVVEKGRWQMQRGQVDPERSSNRLVVTGGKGKYKRIDAYKQSSPLCDGRMRRFFSEFLHSISKLKNQ